MVKKAQVEIVVIIGVLLLAVVTVYFASQSGIFTPSNVPSGVSDKQKAVKESFINLVRKGADHTLRSMETHGGYPTAELLGGGNYQTPAFVIFMGEGVPYWTRCEQNLIPSKEDVTRWFKLSLENYIKTHISEIADAYKKYNVTFDLHKLSVSVKIPSNQHKIDITVNLPTKVDGYAIQNPLIYPYSTDIETKFGEIYDFANTFSRAQVSKRFLEVFTTASIYLSKDAKDGYPKLPTGGFLTNCGETIYRTPEEISAYLKEIANYVVTQTLWWQNMPADPSKPKVYAINSEILGTEYRDLDISMYLPDNFAFDTGESMVITNGQPAYTSRFWTSPDCLSVYRMAYSVSYPVVVRVKDPLSGHAFNFAALVFVDNAGATENGNYVEKMMPGKCENMQSGENCKDLNCYAKIKVTDESGNSLSGAVASFGGCGLGTSDASGSTEGKIKCGTYELNIYKNSSYDYYSQNASSSGINMTYILRSIPEFTAHFRKVTITEQCEVYSPATGSSNTITYIPCSAIANSCTGTRKITKCVVENLNDYAYVEFASGGRQFMVTNLNASNVNVECTKTTECTECRQTGDTNKCKLCSSGCAGSILESVLESVKIKYMPSDNYYVNATVMNINTMKETSGFINPGYELKPTSELYFNIPASALPDYRLSEGEKICLAQKLAGCQIEPVSKTEPETTITES